VVQDRRAAGDGAAEIGEDQARVLGQVLAIDAGVGEPRAIQDRLLGLELAQRPVAVQVLALHRAELLVGGDSRAHLQETRSGAGRHHHPAGLGQVGRQAMDLPALESGLAHQGDVAHRQVAEPPVDQLRGSARGSRGEVLGLEQRDRETRGAAIPRDPGAGDASADHRAVEALPLQPIEVEERSSEDMAGAPGMASLSRPRLGLPRTSFARPGRLRSASPRCAHFGACLSPRRGRQAPPRCLVGEPGRRDRGPRRRRAGRVREGARILRSGVTRISDPVGSRDRGGPQIHPAGLGGLQHQMVIHHVTAITPAGARRS
jgi:hypothetical protein